MTQKYNSRDAEVEPRVEEIDSWHSNFQASGKNGLTFGNTKEEAAANYKKMEPEYGVINFRRVKLNANGDDHDCKIFNDPDGHCDHPSHQQI